MNQQQMQQALIGHDRIWCTMDFPLFYVKQRKDTISPLQLVERLKRAACIAGWDTPLNPDQQKTNNFFSLCKTILSPGTKHLTISLILIGKFVCTQKNNFQSLLSKIFPQGFVRLFSRSETRI